MFALVWLLCGVVYDVLKTAAILTAPQDKELDFYIVSQPAWLEAKFPEEAKRVNKPAVALISTDPTWIL